MMKFILDCNIEKITLIFENFINAQINIITL